MSTPGEALPVSRVKDGFVELSAPGEDLPVSRMNDIYPGIDPAPHFAHQTYAGKSILVTGGSRGIGLEITLFYAKAGANIVLVARDQSGLDSAKATILAASVPNSKVITSIVDVTDTKAVKSLVEFVVSTFGRLDIVVANAGKADPWRKPFTEYDPDNWWRTMEVNIRGVYNIAHFTLPELAKTKGYHVIIGSLAGQMRMPFASSYVTSKHAVNRLNEYIAIENPDVKAFSVNPGAIDTEMAKNNPEAASWLIDTLQLPAATLLRLTSGREDWLNGKFVNSNWNLDEVEVQFKEKIIEQGALVNRLHIPH
ncbi:NAD-P-binding protein [Pluteus cervinus]|uniref:NAD-P-binding protein n=1 Tax=Pluteus cervinus TaxID=181527 RepID=A0ACD3A658_9AGAR|nr:NAD-P-binding protein [Pluteus cervinus]